MGKVKSYFWDEIIRRQQEEEQFLNDFNDDLPLLDEEFDGDAYLQFLEDWQGYCDLMDGDDDE